MEVVSWSSSKKCNEVSALCLSVFTICYVVLLEVMYVVNLPGKKPEFIFSYRIF